MEIISGGEEIPGVFMIIGATTNMLRSFLSPFWHISWNIFSKISINPLNIV